MGERNCAYCKAKDCGRAGHNYPIDSSFECFVAITNADRIRASSDENLAANLCTLFCRICDRCPIAGLCSQFADREKTCNDVWLDWLQSPAEGGSENKP